jgi:hypothetical protein
MVIIIGVLGLALTIYIAYRASISDKELFPLSLLALFAGLLFESFRVSDNWKSVVEIFVGSYVFSLLTFLPGKREQHYNFENHIQTWPYFFLCFFALAYAIFYKEKVTTKLTEGLTLLLSISFIYWIVDYGFTNYHNWFAITLLIIASLLSMFAIINALTHFHLEKKVRLILSVWSSVILFAFAVDNIIRVFTNTNIDSSKHISDRIFLGLQYVLLGMSAVYIMRNLTLLTSFFPSKNGNYREDLEENIDNHINRFSDQQVHIGHAFFCILYAGTFYLLNYRYQLLPRHTMIWLVLVTFPVVIQMQKLVYAQKKINLYNL